MALAGLSGAKTRICSSRCSGVTGEPAQTNASLVEARLTIPDLTDKIFEQS